MKPLLLLFPWVAFLQKGDKKKALISLFLQLSLIGWIPAYFWAITVVNEEDIKKQKVERILRQIQQVN